MEFPNKFKIGWWILLLIILTTLVVVRWEAILSGNTSQFDLVVFVTWVFLLLFPIVGEVNMFGFKIRKDIKDFREEFKDNIISLRAEINNNPTFNNYASPPTSQEDKESKKKVDEKEINEQIDIDKSIKNRSSQLRSLRVRAKKAEEVVGKYLADLYGKGGYGTEVKIGRGSKALVVDAAVIVNNEIEKLIEIKYFSPLALRRMVDRRIREFERRLRVASVTQDRAFYL
ncbi:hypothetical protein HOC35_04805, partial [Candidatus Woesearchaeota archaeon]|nr:hypothetical protein [Candidatus Woesearchaeota archaeon]